jgi:hypothetical protein
MKTPEELLAEAKAEAQHLQTEFQARKARVLDWMLDQAEALILGFGVGALMGFTLAWLVHP